MPSNADALIVARMKNYLAAELYRIIETSDYDSYDKILKSGIATALLAVQRELERVEAESRSAHPSGARE